jgi:hypothetical protein
MSQRSLDAQASFQPPSSCIFMSVNMWLDLVRFAGPYYIIFFFLRTEFTEVDVNADLVCVCVCV